jgi:thiol-disulfide isomerase/thioredoxin
MLKTISLMIYLGVASGTLCASTAGEVAIGQILPNATVRGLNGPARSLADFRGRPLIINLWASWCGPCREEMASLERLAWREEGRDFAIIGISTDDYPEAALRLLKLSNATISHFIDTRMEMEHMLGASRLPLTVLVSAEGRVVEKVYGARQWDSADALRLIDHAFHDKTTTPRTLEPRRTGLTITLPASACGAYGIIARVHLAPSRTAPSSRARLAITQTACREVLAACARRVNGSRQ